MQLIVLSKVDFIGQIKECGRECFKMVKFNGQNLINSAQMNFKMIIMSGHLNHKFRHYLILKMFFLNAKKNMIQLPLMEIHLTKCVLCWKKKHSINY